MAAEKKKRVWLMIGAVVLLAALIIWAVRVIQFNRDIRALDEVPVEDAVIGEFVSFDHNYTYGYDADGYSARVNSYEILDTEDYLAARGKTKEDYPNSYERVCIVKLTVRYDAPSDGTVNEGLNVGAFLICGLDYYEGQNPDFFDLENPSMEGSSGIIVDDGREYQVTLVFNLIRQYYTANSWAHMDQLPMMLFMTAYPVQKNIVLQNPLTQHPQL